MMTTNFLTIKLVLLALICLARAQQNGQESPYRAGPNKIPVMKAKATSQRESVDASDGRYSASWDSLDTRPLPAWYDEAKFGIFIHWGIYSVPSFGSEWFWIKWMGEKNPAYVQFMADNYPPNFSYPEFGPMFTAEFFDPQQWADIFQSSGAKYVVLTSKHHEGFTLWPSEYAFNWNSMDIGPKRDLVGDLAQAIRNNTDLKFGLYYSLMEWYHPIYLRDKANQWTSQNFVDSKMLPEMYDLVNKYEPSVVWVDGDWEPSSFCGNDSYCYWKSTEFISWLYNDSPVKDEVVVNDRWGVGTTCAHGDFYTCTDRYSPGTLQPHKWENCFTIDKKSWGYRRNAALCDYFTTGELVKELVETVSCGGNFLLNVGPTRDGQIAPIFEERLRQIGQWMDVNGQAIYGTVPWTFQNDTVTPDIWYTKGNDPSTDSLYATVVSWPKDGVVYLTAPSAGPNTKITILGYNGTVQWKASSPGIEVTFPAKSEMATDWAWVIRIDNEEVNNNRAAVFLYSLNVIPYLFITAALLTSLRPSLLY